MSKAHDIAAHETLKEALADVVLHSAVSPKAQASELSERLSTVYRWSDAISQAAILRSRKSFQRPAAPAIWR